MITAYGTGRNAEQLLELGERLDQAVGQLATITCRDAFGDWDRPVSLADSPLFDNIFAKYYWEPLRERVTLELVDELASDLAGEGEARDAIRRVSSRVSSTLEVALSGRLVLSVTDLGKPGAVVESVAQMLRDRGVSTWSAPRRMPRVLPSVDRTLLHVAAALALATLGGWALPADSWWIALAVCVAGAGVGLAVWHERRPARTSGGWALLAVVGLVVFACLYALVGATTRDAGAAAHFGDYLLMAIGMSAGGALFDVHLIGEAPRIFAHAQLLLTIGVLAGALQAGARAAASWVLDRFGSLVPEQQD